MTSDIAQSTLRRMMGDARAHPHAPSVSRLLRLALERTAEDLLGLTFEVTSMRQSQCALDMVVSRFPQNGMIALLEGEAQGAAVVETGLLSGLVEFQTIGRVLPNLAAGRSATRVDAALVAPFLDAALTAFDDSVTGQGQAPWARGYVFGAMVADVRTLLLALNAESFHVFEIEVSLCNGARQGTLTLVFAEQEDASQTTDAATGRSEGGDALRQAVLSSPAAFHAVIGQLSIPLQHLQELKVGDTLSLPAKALREVRLEAVGGDYIISANLGQLNGFRAVRLKGAQPAAATNTQAGRVKIADVATDAPGPMVTENPPQQNAAGQELPVDPGEDLEDLDDLDTFLNDAQSDTDMELA
ncbi:flagellar motor switch protein FliM [Shimia gijangensis]|uniref:Flagellar motor switch protein FliM n=1 Tax=Shimia gijangensis TaxID=1470563 RepID=A0A1M6E1U3_9RHOB|nr:FliM/FliN family flagellar motor C-terminal domain-containing protein [Shimia gijangensis]SHI79411.1 flagellar motor switch protein FliM [Shimia gijangensis]